MDNEKLDRANEMRLQIERVEDVLKGAKGAVVGPGVRALAIEASFECLQKCYDLLLADVIAKRDGLQIQFANL